jgi:hypothetical protein
MEQPRTIIEEYPDHESHVVTWSLVRFTQMAVMHEMWW